MGVVGLAWVFFRAPDFGAAFEVLGGIASGRGGGVPAEWTARAVIVAAALLLIDVPQYVGRNPVTIVRWPAIARGMVYAVWVLLIVLARGDGANPFLYFQF